MAMLEHTARAEQILTDLVEYIGRDRELVRQRCKSAMYELAWQWPKTKSTLDFYRESDLYIFDLTLYQAMMVPDVNYMVEEAEIHKFKKVLDFGGGIGEYTLRLIKEANAEVTFLELKDSKTLEYAKWRFKKYGIKPHIVNEDYTWQNEDWDAVVVMDVLEHLEDPKPVIEALKKRAKNIYANPEKVKYNQYYPQHISHFELDGFKNLEINLYQNISK